MGDKLFNQSKKTEGVMIIDSSLSSKGKNNKLLLGKKSFTTNRNKSALNLIAGNPQFFRGFNEQDLFYATNQYHMLDKMGNINQNKAFALTILSESLAKNSQN